MQYNPNRPDKAAGFAPVGAPNAKSLDSGMLLDELQQSLARSLDSIRAITERLDQNSNRLLGPQVREGIPPRPDVPMQSGQINVLVHMSAELNVEIDAAHRAVDFLARI